VPVGGFVIFDDLGSHAEVSRSWDDFCVDQGIREVLEFVRPDDPQGAFFRKQNAVRVDQSKRRPFMDVNK
jgi:hypothetical protein